MAEKILGFPNGTLQKYLSGKNIGSDKIEKITSTFPTLNASWWFTGKGEMLIREQESISYADSMPHEDPKSTFVRWMAQVERKLTNLEKEVIFLQAKR